MSQEDEGVYWMTPVELAERYRVPVQTLYGWRLKGYGPVGVRIGRGVRYRRSDVEAWEAEQVEAAR